MQDSEHPIKDSAQSMNNSDRKSLPQSSGSGGMRSVSSNQRSGSGGIRGIMENLSRHDDVSGQASPQLNVAAFASLQHTVCFCVMGPLCSISPLSAQASAPQSSCALGCCCSAADSVYALTRDESPASLSCEERQERVAGPCLQILF